MVLKKNPQCQSYRFCLYVGLFRLRGMMLFRFKNCHFKLLTMHLNETVVASGGL